MDFDDIMARSYRVLRDFEWAGDENMVYCHSCGNGKTQGHYRSCELAAILATEADWKAHIARRREILAQDDTTTP